jgi:hypothetical protein
VGDYFEKVAGARISFWAKHSHQAFCGLMRKSAQLLKSHGGIDVIAQYRFACVEISGKKAFNAFAQ